MQAACEHPSHDNTIYQIAHRRGIIAIRLMVAESRLRKQLTPAIVDALPDVPPELCSLVASYVTKMS
jgi:hypothetical protein